MTSNAPWVMAHPDQHPLTAHLRDVGTEALRRDGWDVVESDLYTMNFDPIRHADGGSDVEAEQAKVMVADLIVLQFPLWWYGMPAMLKGWIDRVFQSGFAYDILDPDTGRKRKYGDGGLVGRRALAVTTAGERAGSFGRRGLAGHIDDVLWPLLHGTFWYTGMLPLRPHLVPDALVLDGSVVQEIDAELVERLHGVAAEEPIRYRPMTDEHYDHSVALHPHVAPEVEGNAAHVLG